MAKKFSHILIPIFIFAIFLAPVSPLLEIYNAQPTIQIKENSAQAQITPTTPWYYESNDSGTNTIHGPYNDFKTCNEQGVDPSKIIRYCFQSTTTPTASPSGTQAATPPATGIQGDSNLYNRIDSCGALGIGGNVVGCFVLIYYFFLVSIPSFLMGMTAQIFDFTTMLTLSDRIYRLDFISTIWKIVRDFSNIFFILILLYAAFQILLGLGGGNGKKIVASVILLALLVNFSLFITRVIVDSSNVLGLIFYNKITTTNAGYVPMSDNTKTGVDEKDIAGTLISAFNPNAFFTGEFLDGLDTNSHWFRKDSLKPMIAISLMTVYGLVIYSLAWVFLVVGLSFLGRILMLMLLMIVSPLAFVTAAVPRFRSIDTIGFDSWIKKLIQVSFVAVVFMFILYIVAEILKAKVFSSVAITQSTSLTAKLVLLFLPAIMIVVLLKKGSEYAQSASGEFTGAILGGAKFLGGLAGGLAIGAATGGAAIAGSRLIGGAASSKLSGASGEALRQKANEKGLSGYMAKMQLKALDYTSKAHFDARKTSLGNLASQESGMNFQSSSVLGLGSKDGGYRGIQERSAEKLEKESKLYKTSMTNDQVKAWSQAERFKYEAGLNEAKEEARQKSPNKKLSAREALYVENKYKKNNGEKPQEFTTADGLNASRMKDFKENIATSGFLGSLAYEYVKGKGKPVDKDNYKNSIDYTNWEHEKNEKKAAEMKLQEANGADPATKAERGRKFDKYYEEFIKKAPTVESINEKNKGGLVDEHNYRDSKEYRQWDKDKEETKRSEAIKQGFSKLNPAAKTKWESEFEDTYAVLHKKAPTAENINAERVKEVKLVIGAAAGALTGGLLGGAVGAGVLGTMTGGSVGAIDAASAVPGAAKFGASLDKQLKSTEKLNIRIKELSDTIAKGKGVEFELFKRKADGTTVETDSSGKAIMHKESIFVRSSTGELTDEIDQDKLEEAIEIKNIRLEELKKNKKDPNVLLERIRLSKEKSLLMSLRTAEEKLIDMTGRKEAVSGSGSKPSTPKP